MMDFAITQQHIDLLKEILQKNSLPDFSTVANSLPTGHYKASELETWHSELRAALEAAVHALSTGVYRKENSKWKQLLQTAISSEKLLNLQKGMEKIVNKTKEKTPLAFVYTNDLLTETIYELPFALDIGNIQVTVIDVAETRRLSFSDINIRIEPFKETENYTEFYLTEHIVNLFKKSIKKEKIIADKSEISNMRFASEIFFDLGYLAPGKYYKKNNGSWQLPASKQSWPIFGAMNIPDNPFKKAF